MKSFPVWQKYTIASTDITPLKLSIRATSKSKKEQLDQIGHAFHLDYQAQEKKLDDSIQEMYLGLKDNSAYMAIAMPTPTTSISSEEREELTYWLEPPFPETMPLESLIKIMKALSDHGQDNNIKKAFLSLSLDNPLLSLFSQIKTPGIKQLIVSDSRCILEFDLPVIYYTIYPDSFNYYTFDTDSSPEGFNPPLEDTPAYSAFFLYSEVIDGDETKEKVVGSVMFDHHMTNNTKVCHVETLWIDKAYRGLGLSRVLMNLAETYAIRKNCDHMQLETMEYQAPGLYEKKLGFTCTDTRQLYPYTVHYESKRISNKISFEEIRNEKTDNDIPTRKYKEPASGSFKNV